MEINHQDICRAQNLAVFIPDMRAKAGGRENGLWRRRRKGAEEGSLGTQCLLFPRYRSRTFLLGPGSPLLTMAVEKAPFIQIERIDNLSQATKTRQRDSPCPKASILTAQTTGSSMECKHHTIGLQQTLIIRISFVILSQERFPSPLPTPGNIFQCPKTFIPASR